MNATEPLDTDDELPARLSTADLQAHADAMRAKAPAELPERPHRPLPGMAEAHAAAKRASLAAAWSHLVPEQFREARLADFTHCRAHATGRDGCADCDDARAVLGLLTVWTNQAEGQNLVIGGPIGVGKTHAGFAAARVPFGEGETVVYHPVGMLLRALHWENADAGQVMERACTAGVLYLDDLGVERSNDLAQDQLYDIINHRWSESLPMIVTSNLAPDDLREHLGKQGRSYSRLSDNAIGVHIGGADRRGQ